MKVRQKTYLYEPDTGKKLNLRFKLSSMIRFGAIVAAVIVVIVFAAQYLHQRDIRNSYLAGKEIITVGMRADVAGFGTKDENGDLCGYDADVITEVLHGLYGSEVPVRFFELTTEDAGATMKYAQTDITLGFLVSGSDRTDGFALSDPYYYDDVLLVLRPGGSLSDFSALAGKNIGILNSMITVKTATEWVDKTGIEAEVLRYYDYTTAQEDLTSGKMEAFMCPRAIADQYFADYPRAQETLFTVGYCIMVPNAQKATANLINSELSELKAEGTLRELAQKWNIRDGNS